MSLKMEIQTDPAKLKPLVIGDKVFRSCYDCELSLEDVDQARRELNETEDVRSACLRDLKKKLSKHGAKCRTDDAYLLRFLRYRKFRCQKAYEDILYFCSMRREHPEIFNSLPPNLEELLNLNLFSFLPYRDEHGSIIINDKLGKWDPHKLTTYDLWAFGQILIDIFSMNPSCQINKVICIMNFEGTHAGMLPAALSTIRFWMKALQNMHTFRVKHIILLNCHSLVYTFLKTVRLFLKKKLADRIVIIGSDVSELHEYMNPAILPKEYGGSLEESECSITDHIMNNLPYLKYEHSFFNSSL